MPAVLRRYTPPTCTLEIMAAGSALSRWTDRQVFKQVKFHLRLDDPRVPQEDRITLTGDRTQLEALCQAVSSYVQTVLVLSPTAAQRSIPAAPPNPAADVHLTARSLLSHTLHLGELATPETGSSLSLTVTQLADLATALDAYQADAIALPTLSRSTAGMPLGWGTIAAATVLILGTTFAIVQFSPSTTPPTASDTDNLDESPIALDSGTAETATPETFSSESSTDAPSDRPTTETAPSSSAPTAADRPERPNLDQLDDAPSADRPTNPSNAVPPPAPIPPSMPNEPPETTLAQPEAESDLDSLESSITTARQAPSDERDAAIAEPPRAPTAATPPADLRSGTAFDRVPQVAEVRQYFQQRWSPPQDLEQPLEYQLSIDASGAVQSVTPLGQTARDYRDRAMLPILGQTVVSPTTGESLRIRVLLSPEGSVQTFLEPTNP